MLTIERAQLEDAEEITKIKTVAFNKEINTYIILLDDCIIGAFFLYYEGDDIFPHVKEWKLSASIFSVGNQHLYEKFGYIETWRNDDEIFYSKTI